MGNYKNKKEFESRIKAFKFYLGKGNSIASASKLAGISSTTAIKYAKTSNVVVRKNARKPINHDYFSIINTEVKAYLLGFFLADGCIQSGYGENRLSVNNSVDDLEVIEKFKSEICPEHTIHIRRNPDKKDSATIRWSSQWMIEDLKTFGIEPRKTFDFQYTFPFHLLSENLIRHFIRGFFDGDGSVSGGLFQFITTSKPFAYQLIQVFEERFNVIGRIREKQTKNVIEYMFYFNAFQKRKDFLTKLYDWLYKDSTIFLERKRKKIESFTNTVLT